MPAKGPTSGVLPADFDEAVTVLAGRRDPLAARHHRRHRRVLTWALAEIEISRGDNLARVTVRAIPIPVSAGCTVETASALLQCHRVRLVEGFTGLRLDRGVHWLRGNVTGQYVA